MNLASNSYIEFLNKEKEIYVDLLEKLKTLQ